MDYKLIAEYERIQKECEALEGKGVKGDDGQDLKSELKKALMKMLIYICLLDENVGAGEIQFINEALGTALGAEDIKKFSSSNTEISASEPIDALQRFCLKIAKGRLENKTALEYREIVSFVNSLGVSFIASDGRADERETAYLGSLVFRVRAFCESYRKSVDRISKDEPKVQISVQKGGKAEKEPEKEKTLDELMEKLDSLIGLERVKQEVYSLSNLIKVRKLREERGFRQPDMSLHLVFTGNPGTGKTTVARLLSQIYYKLGAVKKNVFVEVDRSGLVSNYIGHTALKTKEVCESAMGGVLFIDEAYALTCGTGKNDFGQEAVNTLLKFMEDNRGALAVICAGYTDLMQQFLESNPGLRSRFNRFIEFDDYSAGELRAMFALYCSQYKLEATEEALDIVQRFFEERIAHKTENFANGRDARNLFEKALSKQADRLAPLLELSDSDLLTLTAEDVKGIEL